MLEGEAFRPTGIEDAVETTIREFIDEMRVLKEEEYNSLCKMLIKDSSAIPSSLSKLASRLYSDKRL